MKLPSEIISRDCPDLICRVCRTKCGWKHQVWCASKDQEELSCEDCYYFRSAAGDCSHPHHRHRKEKK